MIVFEVFHQSNMVPFEGLSSADEIAAAADRISSFNFDVLVDVDVISFGKAFLKRDSGRRVQNLTMVTPQALMGRIDFSKIRDRSYVPPFVPQKTNTAFERQFGIVEPFEPFKLKARFVESFDFSSFPEVAANEKATQTVAAARRNKCIQAQVATDMRSTQTDGPAVPLAVTVVESSSQYDPVDLTTPDGTDARVKTMIDAWLETHCRKRDHAGQVLVCGGTVFCKDGGCTQSRKVVF